MNFTHRPPPPIIHPENPEPGDLSIAQQQPDGSWPQVIVKAVAGYLAMAADGSLSFVPMGNIGAGYLPLAGGTMTGKLSFGVAHTSDPNVVTNGIVLYDGTAKMGLHATGALEGLAALDVSTGRVTLFTGHADNNIYLRSAGVDRAFASKRGLEIPTGHKLYSEGVTGASVSYDATTGLHTFFVDGIKIAEIGPDGIHIHGAGNSVDTEVLSLSDVRITGKPTAPGDVLTATDLANATWGTPAAGEPIPGPPNVLTIGTVTEGPAAATITGTSPAQVLSLVIPKGEKGDPATGSSATIGDVKSAFLAADHTGWIKLDGRAITTLTETQQTAAAGLGFATNLPDATGAVPMQGGALGEVVGSMERKLTQANLPAVDLTASDAAAHHHPARACTNDQGTVGFSEPCGADPRKLLIKTTGIWQCPGA